MTQQMKVSVSQWLITAVAGLFGIWGGYQVLQYKVMENQKDIACIEVEAKKGDEKVWTRFENDRVERYGNREMTKEILKDVIGIKKSFVLNDKEHKEIKADIKEVLKKVN